MSLSDREYLQINQALFSLVNAYEERASEEDVAFTVAERSVIMVLGQLAPINSRQLAEAMHISPGPVSLQVQKLVEKGLIVKEQDRADRRNWWLNLTEDGQRAYQDTLSNAAQYTRDFLSALDEDEKQHLHRLLQKASHSLGYDWQ
ncbi:MAG: MarR family transcriptional regulator [Anaerolineae bacterium]|nr:MarR family transcriptional regulator [Anaerolineae bacterium]